MHDIFISLAVSLGLTLVFELGFALLLKIRGRDLVLVVLVNFLTNPPVVLLSAFFSQRTNLLPALYVLPLEIAAVLIEAVCYKYRATGIKKPLLFSLGANAFSYGLGLMITTFI